MACYDRACNAIGFARWRCFVFPPSVPTALALARRAEIAGQCRALAKFWFTDYGVHLVSTLAATRKQRWRASGVQMFQQFLAQQLCGDGALRVGRGSGCAHITRALHIAQARENICRRAVEFFGWRRRDGLVRGERRIAM